MVKVISAYNFQHQNIYSITGDITASCLIKDDRLAIAHKNHLIEILRLKEHKTVINNENITITKEQNSDVNAGDNNDHDDSKNEATLVSIIPTVDEVLQLLYSEKGNFLLTLEQKSSSDTNNDGKLISGNINYNNISSSSNSIKHNYQLPITGSSTAKKNSCNLVRVYSNFDIVNSENYFSIPIRARIASKITPKTNSSECIEVIELPYSTGSSTGNSNYNNPTLIECCQNSGTIIVSYGYKLIFYQYRQCLRDAQKFSFIDFFEYPFYIKLEFIPLKLKITENVIACSNQSCLIVFKIVDLNEEDTEDGSSTSNSSLITDSSVTVCQDQISDLIDFDVAKQCNHVNGVKFEADLHSNWDTDGSVNDMNSCFTEEAPNLINDIKIILKYNETNNAQQKNDRLFYSIKSLLQLRLKRSMKQNKRIHDEFRSLALKPIYYKSNNNSNSSNGSSNSNDNNNINVNEEKEEILDRTSEITSSHIMKSDEYKNCIGYSFFLSTVSDGYLYQFTNQGKWYTENMKCLATYPFTAPVIDIVIDNYVIHAITECGIETFSSRIGHKLFSSYFEYPMISDPYPAETSPLVDVPICIMGICGFFGIKHVVYSNEKFILLATDKELTITSQKFGGGQLLKKTATVTTQYKYDNKWTIYDLQYPSPEILVTDIQNIANVYANSSPEVYYELLEEAHVIIRLASETINSYNNKADNNGKNNSTTKESLNKTFIETCKLLGDFTIISDRKDIYSQAVAYYTMSKQTIWDIYKNFMLNNDLEKMKSINGLIYTIKIMLSRLGNNKNDAEYLNHIIQPIISTRKDDMIKKEEKKHYKMYNEHTVAEELFELFKNYITDEIASICLSSSAFREILNNSIIEWLENKTTQLNSDEKLCLVLCYCRNNNINKAILILETMNRKETYEIFKSNWTVLFDNFNPHNYRKSSFSDIMENVIFVTDKLRIIEGICDVLIYILSIVRLIDLDFILKLFMNYFAGYIGHKGYKNSQRMLEIILQAYFYDIYNNNNSSNNNNNHNNNNCNSSGSNNNNNNRNILMKNSDISDVFLTQSQSNSSGAAAAGNEILNYNFNNYCNNNNNIADNNGLGIKNPLNVIVGSSYQQQQQQNQFISKCAEDSPTSTSTTVDSNYEDPEFHALKILFRMYLGFLKQYSGNSTVGNNSSEEKYENDDIISYRLTFLDYMFHCVKAIKSVHIKLDRKVIHNRSKYIIIPDYDKCDPNDLNMEKNPFRRPIVYLERREKYLNYMEPFNESSFKLDSDGVLYFDDWDNECHLNIVKVQALLNSGKLDNPIVDDFVTFIHSNPHVIGIDSLMTILLPKPEGVEFLIHVNPNILLQYGKCRLTTGNQWQALFNRILKKKRENENNSKSTEIFDKVIKDILKDLVQEKSLDDFIACIPENETHHETESNNSKEKSFTPQDGIDESNPFQVIIRDVVVKQRSEALQAMIQSTGRHLFSAVYNYQWN